MYRIPRELWKINMNTTDAAAAEIAIGSAYTVRKNPFALIFSVLMIASIKPITIERITRITENFSVVTKLLRNVPSVKIFV